MRLDLYLDRIGYEGSVEPDLATLAALLRAHVCSVPFENLDVQLGRAISTRAEDAFEKIVANKRGGWCFEQNGLFGWVLSQLGFDVCRVAGGVMREQRGEATAANHLCLVVSCPGSTGKYLVDVGFGGSMISPIALEVAEHSQPPFKIGLSKLEDGYWRFWEDLGKGRFSYDFVDEPANEQAIDAKCAFLQSDPSSGFVQNLVAQRRTADQHRVLRGRVFTVARPGSNEERLVESPEAMVAILAGEFGLDVPEVAGLWPRIVDRHKELFEGA